MPQDWKPLAHEISRNQHDCPSGSFPPRPLGLVAFTIIYEIATKGESILIKPENLLNILRQVSFVGIIAMGMTLVITLGGIDLSVGSLVAFLGGIGILLLNRLSRRHTPELMAVLGAFA